MLIKCERGLGDNRYFVTVRIGSLFLSKSFSATFLIDTGACKTSLSWDEAKLNLISNLTLPIHFTKDGQVSGTGYGLIDLYKISLVRIAFASTIGDMKSF